MPKKCQKGGNRTLLSLIQSILYIIGIIHTLNSHIHTPNNHSIKPKNDEISKNKQQHTNTQNPRMTSCLRSGQLKK